MNPAQGPVGPDREFTDEALNAKFSYAFTRKQLIVLIGLLRPLQLPIGDMRNRVILEVVDEIERTAIQSIGDNDYKNPEPSPAPPTLSSAQEVKVN